MKSNGPDIAILGIGTAVPPYRLEQEEASSKLTDALVESGHRQAARWAGKIFRNCGVETRYTCEPELLNQGDRCRYVAYSRPQEVPSTEERMEKFRIEAARRSSATGHRPAWSVARIPLNGECWPWAAAERCSSPNRLTR